MSASKISRVDTSVDRKQQDEAIQAANAAIETQLQEVYTKRLAMSAEYPEFDDASRPYEAAVYRGILKAWNEFQIKTSSKTSSKTNGGEDAAYKQLLRIYQEAVHRSYAQGKISSTEYLTFREPARVASWFL